MDFVALILTPVINSLMVPVKRTLNFLVSSSKYVRGLHNKQEVLDAAARDMQNQLGLNNANSRMIPHRVPGWLEEVEDLKAEIAEKIPAGGVGCCNLKMKYKAGKYSSDIAERIDGLLNERDGMVWTDQLIPLGRVSPPRSPTSSVVHKDDQSQNKSTIESRDLIFKDVLKSLEPSNQKIQKMALCGMGGIGKTTLMKQLKKAARDRKMFQSIVYLEVGQNPNVISLQQVVAEQLGEALTETVVYTRADRLQKRFELLSEEGKNKILIILDDVWEKFELEDIGLTNSLSNGFKLLITSRKEDVCNDMCGEIGSLFEIIGLKEPEDKKLFWESAGLLPDDIEPDLRHIGEDIVKRCGGLPLALVTIGSNLRNKKKKSEWNNALLRMRNKKFSDVLTSIFMFSYENLQEDDVKAIFLLSGLLSEDNSILMDDLLMYGWGLRLFKCVSTVAEARDSLETCINTLIRSNLLIRDDQEGCVKIHDLIRDFALSNFSEVKQASIVFDDKGVLEQIREEKAYERVLLKCRGMSEFPTNFDHQKLSFLKLMDGDQLLKLPVDFSIKMENLKVVACDRMHKLLLPQFSINVRVLFLRHCSLVDDDISSIGDLTNMEVLSLVGCGIKRLPSKIGNSKKLRLLDLTENDDLCIDGGVLEKLEKLEELYIGVFKKGASKCTDAECKELKVLSRTLSALEIEFFQNEAPPFDVSFEYLERFRISVGCKLGLRSNNSFKNTLKLNGSSRELAEWNISKLFVKTERLHLGVEDMSYLEDIFVNPPQSPFPNLKKLGISKCASLTYLFTVPVAKSLKKLESLKISSCSVLKSVVSGEHSETGVIMFPVLKILHLKELPELVSLCDLVNVIELPQLVDLLLDGLPNITSFFNGENTSNIAKQSFLKIEDVIPNLKKLTIRAMENLKEIWSCESASGEEEVNTNFMFREIEVRNCNSLENLFPRNPMQLLSHLEKLEVEYCGSIEVLFHIDLLETEHLNSSSSSLRKIVVRDCDSLENLFPRNIVQLLGHLEEIEVGFCGSMKVLFHIDLVETEHLNSSLRRIAVRNCGSLKNLFPSNLVQLLSHLEVIEVDACGSLEVLFNIDLVETEHLNSSSSSSLRRIEVRKCESFRDVWRLNDADNNYFDLLTHGLQDIESIIIGHCKRFRNIVTPTSLNFDMRALKYIHIWDCGEHDERENELVKNSQGQEIVSVSKEVTSKVGVFMSIEALPSHRITLSFHHLREIELHLKGVEVVFDIVGALSNRGESVAAQQKPLLLLPHLETLELGNMNTLTHVWKCSNWNAFITYPIHQPQPSSLQNLTTIRLSYCKRIKYLFSPLMVKLLSNLKTVDIEDCDGMEEVVSSRDDEDEEMIYEHATNTLFPHLDLLKLSSLDNLKRIGGGFSKGITDGKSKLSHVDVVSWTLSQYSREIDINGCGALSSVIPCFTAGRMQKLQVLSIKDCKSLADVFDQPITYTSVHKFPNLKTLEIFGCELLEFVFTFSTLESLKNLETLKVVKCKAMKVIMKEDVREDTSTSSKEIVFPHLKSITLDLLPNFEGVYLGTIAKFECPLLDNVRIDDCPQMMALISGPLIAPMLKYIQTKLGKHSCEGVQVTPTLPQPQTLSPSLDGIISSRLASSKGEAWSFHNLIESHVEDYYNDTKIFPSNELQKLQKLETVHVKVCPMVEQIFEVVLEEKSSESQTVVTFPKLRILSLSRTYHLECIWKSNPWTTLRFPNLTRLKLKRCNSIKYVFTSSMVGCVVQLQELHIDHCGEMKVVVKEEDEDGDCKVIKFPCLKSLKLKNSRSLKGFSLRKDDFTFPDLDTLVIKWCQALSVFTHGSLVAPKLTTLDTSFEAFNVTGEDLNSFIRTKKQEGFSFGIDDTCCIM